MRVLFIVKDYLFYIFMEISFDNGDILLQIQSWEFCYREDFQYL